MRREFLSRSAGETRDLGAALGRVLRGGEVISLEGELGSGKTIFVKGLARGLGIDPGRITSPTYVLHHIHDGRLRLHHLDLYRLKDSAEFEDLGIADYLGGDSVLAIEWGDRFAASLSESRLTVSLAAEDREHRRVVMAASSTSLQRLVEAIHDAGPPPG